MYTLEHETIAATCLEVANMTREQGRMINLFRVTDRLCAQYEEPWRHYHNLGHIADGCMRLWNLRPAVHDYVTLVLAWLGHDFVWMPGYAHNEEMSAQLFEPLLEEVGVMRHRIGHVTGMIRSTKEHLVPEHFSGSKEDCSILHDVDLAGLGETREVYLRNGELVRAELGLREDVWLETCAKFARHFLERPYIYKTRHFKHLEPRARSNLSYTIDQAEHTA